MIDATVNIFVRVVSRKQDNGDTRTATEILSQDYPDLTQSEVDEIVNNM